MGSTQLLVLDPPLGQCASRIPLTGPILVSFLFRGECGGY